MAGGTPVLWCWSAGLDMFGAERICDGEGVLCLSSWCCSCCCSSLLRLFRFRSSFSAPLLALLLLAPADAVPFASLRERFADGFSALKVAALLPSAVDDGGAFDAAGW